MNSIPRLLTEPTEFVHKGFTFRALPHQKERIIKIFEKHLWFLCPDVSDGYILFNWLHISRNEPEIWDILLALSVISHDEKDHYEVVVSTGETVNPVAFDRPTFFTKELYAKRFVQTFLPPGEKHRLVKH